MHNMIQTYGDDPTEDERTIFSDVYADSELWNYHAIDDILDIIINPTILNNFISSGGTVTFSSRPNYHELTHTIEISADHPDKKMVTFIALQCKRS